MDILVRRDVFHFKMFDICQDKCLMKVCTDGVLLGAWVHLKNVKTSLDIGTGTGVIALMMAQRSHEIEKITGVEIHEETCIQAHANALASKWSHRLEMVHSSIQDFSLSRQFKFDLIVSNPPFFTGGTLSESQLKNDVRHTVKLPHNELLRSVKQLMSKKGRFGVILPVIEGYRFIELAEQYGLYLIRLCRVYSRLGKPVERFLMEFTHHDGGKLEQRELYIHTPENDRFSDEYKLITGDFYLDF